MASLKECRARANKLGLTVIRVPKTDYWYKKGDRYVLQGRKVTRRKDESYEDYEKRRHVFHYEGRQAYAKTVADLSKDITTLERLKRKSEMMVKLNGHRLKYGYKTVPRKPRKKR